MIYDYRHYRSTLKDDARGGQPWLKAEGGSNSQPSTLNSQTIKVLFRDSS